MCGAGVALPRAHKSRAGTSSAGPDLRYFAPGPSLQDPAPTPSPARITPQPEEAPSPQQEAPTEEADKDEGSAPAAPPALRVWVTLPSNQPLELLKVAQGAVS